MLVILCVCWESRACVCTGHMWSWFSPFTHWDRTYLGVQCSIPQAGCSTSFCNWLILSTYLSAVTGACHCTRVFTWGFACRFWRANLDLQDYMESDLNPQPIFLAPQSFYFLSFYLRRKSYISFYFCASVYAYLSTCTPCNGQLPACKGQKRTLDNYKWCELSVCGH